MKCMFLILTIVAVNAFAQTDEAGVKKAVENLFRGMKQNDTALIRSAFTARPILQTVLTNREGKVVIMSEPIDSFLISISHPHTEVYDERITFDAIRIDGDLAMVWAPYKFYLGDKFSHCGVDSFQLVKENGIWKILYLVDTRRRQNCE
jgi:hypothetical protein